MFGFGTYGDVVENSLGGNKTKQRYFWIESVFIILCMRRTADYLSIPPLYVYTRGQYVKNKIHKICVGKFIEMSSDTSYYI